MRFYVGTRVGRHMYLGTGLRPEEAVGVGAVMAVVWVVGPIAAFVLFCNVLWLFATLLAFVQHEWGKALFGLAVWLGWWGFVAAVIWFVRRKRGRAAKEVT